VADIVTAMQAQPRMITHMAGSGVQRAVVDAPARYLALFSSSGGPLVMDRDGIEYRLKNYCFHRSKATHVSPRVLWAGWVAEILASRYTAKVSGDAVLYESAKGTLTVDRRTNLMRSAVGFPVRSNGVKRTSVSFSYPKSVPKLPPPRHSCA
jgi:hypothetical protein